MDAFWWIFLAFLGGGTAGVFLIALMRFAAEVPARRGVSLPKRPSLHR
jgi:hypothetical protein